MEKNLVTEAERYLASRHRDKRRSQLLRILALVVVFATVYMLILPAVTMSNELECGMEAHEHDESCWIVQEVPAQPKLVCTVGQDGALVLHTHDSRCYDGQGTLVCALPEREFHIHGAECYREHRELICTEPQDLGHTHTAACFAKERGELACGQEESGGGHVHTDACYRQERSDELICGQEEGEEHTHTDACYRMVPVKQELKCPLEEGPDVLDEAGNVMQAGHTHGPECWKTEEELRICGQQESAGHTHTDGCYEWIQRTICTEEERPAGHIHTDACYEISQVLDCQKEELAAHTHGESCYGEDGALICGKTEAVVHQHTDACFAAPEEGLEPVKMLICGKEEHVHGDGCYDLGTREEKIYYCGLEEHEHTMPDCYFEDGELKCTRIEHFHTAACMIPPVKESEGPEESADPEQSQGPLETEEPKQPEATSLEIDKTVQYGPTQMGAVMNIRITGTALVEPGVIELVEPDVPLSWAPVGLTVRRELARPLSLTSFLSSLDPDPDADPAPDPAGAAAPDPAVVPDDSIGPDGGGTDGQQPLEPFFPEEFEESEEDEAFEEPEEAEEPPIAQVDPDEIEVRVDELDLSADEFQTMVEQALEGGLTPFTALKFSAQLPDGREVTLEGCTYEIELTLPQSAVQSLTGLGQVYTVDEPDGEAVEAGTEIMITASAPEDLAEADPTADAIVFEQDAGYAQGTVTASSEEGVVVFSARAGQFPEYTVEYWAMLERAIGKEDAEGKDYDSISFIDTTGDKTGGKTGGNLPQNGTPPEESSVYLYKSGNDMGKIVTKKVEKKIYEPKSQFYNTLEPPTIKELSDEVEPENKTDKKHYKLLKVVVTQPDWTERVYPSDTEMTGEMLEKYFERLSFTNTLEAADDHTIAIVKDTKIKMVYDTTTADDVLYDAMFYDYDISAGVKLNANGEIVTENNKPVYVSGMSGINSVSNYGDQSGAKLTFGNANTKVTERDAMWQKSYYINRRNRLIEEPKTDISFKGCTFGIASTIENGALVYSNGIAAPDLFGEKSGTTIGRYDYDEHDLQFIRNGDTYTLSKVTGTGAVNLEKFWHPQAKYASIWTNDFWPMDNKKDGQKDPMFGAGQQGDTELYFEGADGENDREGNPVSDDAKKHNPYFGMKAQVSFTLPTGYTGPLEYLFYGDDDMWVFLDGKLVCDIGGIHSAVGEYVDLWNYIEKDDQNPHTLTFYYTERGASGSTCWIQFTLPNAVSIPTYSFPNLPVDKGLKIQKSVVSDAAKDHDAVYSFELRLGNSTDTFDVKDSNGVILGSVTAMQDIAKATPFKFELKEGEHIQLVGLNPSVTYSVKELNVPEGCEVSFTVNGTESGQKDGIQSGAINGGASLVCTNTFEPEQYELPETGGAGVTYTVACVPLLAAGCLWYKKKSQREGAEDDT